MRSPSLTPTAALLAVSLLVGCHAGATPDGTIPPVPAQSRSASPPRSTPAVWSDGTTGAAPTPGHLGLDDASRDQAIALADRALALYARPDTAYDQWWGDLAPLLSAQATIAYATVDPANIPVRTMTGDAKLEGWDTPEVARVPVPTDVGVFLVVLSRSEADPVWRVERFMAPEVLS